MRAMILAAGRGERMGALTQHTPKPLLRVGDYYLIEHVIYQLKQSGIHEIVINVSYHAEKIKQALGNGNRYNVHIAYSEENDRLETGGGIVKALPLLGERPFVVVSSDIITDFSFASLPTSFDHLAHLIMVTNPPYHPSGDYGLIDGKLTLDAQPRLTFASLGIYHPKLFANCPIEYFRLTKLLSPAVRSGQITGEHYQGNWFNIGTPNDLADIAKKHPHQLLF